MTTLLMILMSLFTFGSVQQNVRCRNISMEDGLRSNAVRNVVQDEYGFIWFGTDNGLCRYDGYVMQHHRIASLGTDQFVSALHVVKGGLLVGTGRGAFFFDQATERFTPYIPGKLTGQVNSFAEDRDGNVWVATMGQGVFRYNASNGRCKRFAFGRLKGNVTQVFVDSDNQVWALTAWGAPALSRLDKARDEFRAVSLRMGDADCRGHRMLQTADGSLWIGTWENGLLRLTADGRVEQMLTPSLTGTATHIHTLLETTSDCLLIGCDEGVVAFNPLTRAWHKMCVDGSGTKPLEYKFIYSILRDREGGLWFGTFYGGVNYFSPVGERFVSYTDGGKGFRGNVVSRFCDDGRGHVWVGSDDGGLSCFSERDNAFIDNPGHALLSGYNVHGLCTDGDYLWVGTYTDGVLRLNTRTGALRRYTTADGLDVGSSYALHRDSRGRLWAATMQSICLYRPATDRFVPVHRTGALVIDIDEDSRGYLWFASQGAGLYRYHPATGGWRQYRSSENRHTLPSDQVNCVHIDVNGRLWAGTMEGLCLYDAVSDSFRRIALDAEVGEINGIIEDQGSLWLATTHGIAKYTPGRPLQLFNKFDGLVSEQFLPNACLKASDGRIFFGGVKGFNTFYPYLIKTNDVAPPVFITALEIFNHRQEVGGELLPEALHHIGEVNLSYRDDMFSLSFASLSYCSPEKNQYAYMLEGFDKDWNYVGSQHTATYTNIPSGTYTFRVKATNNDGLWSRQEARLAITVHPPFWWSLPARLLYLLLVFYLIYLYTQFRLRQAEHRHRRELSQLNERKETEVREARLRFFTMIAHEIRTPVTLIIGPLESLRRKAAGRLSDDLEMIDRNARRLLALVNQLLDFNKVQQAGGQARFRLQNIARLMAGVAERFAPAYRQRGIAFRTDYPPEDFVAVVEPEGLTKIISNLLTNAGKYTKDSIRLACTVDADGRHFRIEVEDNGIGVGKADREKIFNPFFQARDNKPGTGIGLSIVKTLVDLHGGEVSVDSEEGRGARFTVVLPVTRDDVPIGQEEALESPYGQESSGREPLALPVREGEDTPTVLIVEDDADMSGFLAANFRPGYRVVTAENGAEGLERLKEHTVSLIVSDWMMPVMDGAEFCRRVRADRNTSHIPLVMLTAKTDDDSKAEGMECGADAYIEKPFSMKYLEACIRNMLDMRRLLMQKFSNTPSEPIAKIAQTAVDDDFLTRMNGMIEDNIDNPELSVGFIAERMNISRSGLFAKLKLLADVTPNEMIQVVRLRHAARLLREGKYRVNEVCYMVGFSSPSYFSKCFSKQFGVKPAEYK